METLAQLGESAVVKQEMVAEKLKRRRKKGVESALQEQLDTSQKHRARLYSELEARSSRENKIRKVADKLTLQKNLMVLSCSASDLPTLLSPLFFEGGGAVNVVPSSCQSCAIHFCVQGKGKRKKIRNAEGGKPAAFKWSRERKK